MYSIVDLQCRNKRAKKPNIYDSIVTYILVLHKLKSGGRQEKKGEKEEACVLWSQHIISKGLKRS